VAAYQQKMMHELEQWQQKMLRKPGYFNKLSKALQDKVNSWIPEKVHKAITETIKQMIRGVLFGARWTTGRKEPASLEESDQAAEEKIAEGRGTKVLLPSAMCRPCSPAVALASDQSPSYRRDNSPCRQASF